MTKKEKAFSTPLKNEIAAISKKIKKLEEERDAIRTEVDTDTTTLAKVIKKGIRSFGLVSATNAKKIKNEIHVSFISEMLKADDIDKLEIFFQTNVFSIIKKNDFESVFDSFTIASIVDHMRNIANTPGDADFRHNIILKGNNIYYKFTNYPYTLSGLAWREMNKMIDAISHDDMIIEHLKRRIDMNDGLKLARLCCKFNRVSDYTNYQNFIAMIRNVYGAVDNLKVPNKEVSLAKITYEIFNGSVAASKTNDIFKNDYFVKLITDNYSSDYFFPSYQLFGSNKSATGGQFGGGASCKLLRSMNPSFKTPAEISLIEKDYIYKNLKDINQSWIAPDTICKNIVEGKVTAPKLVIPNPILKASDAQRLMESFAHHENFIKLLTMLNHPQLTEYTILVKTLPLKAVESRLDINRKYKTFMGQKMFYFDLFQDYWSQNKYIDVTKRINTDKMVKMMMEYCKTISKDDFIKLMTKKKDHNINFPNIVKMMFSMGYIQPSDEVMLEVLAEDYGFLVNLPPHLALKNKNRLVMKGTMAGINKKKSVTDINTEQGIKDNLLNVTHVNAFDKIKTVINDQLVEINKTIRNKKI